MYCFVFLQLGRGKKRKALRGGPAGDLANSGEFSSAASTCSEDSDRSMDFGRSHGLIK